MDVKQLALVVDDDPRWAEVLSAMLALRGYQSIPCASLAGAFIALSSRPVDLTLLDLMLPDSVTTNTLSKIPALKAIGAGRVVVVTGIPLTTEIMTLAETCGADSILSKLDFRFPSRVDQALGGPV